MTKLLTRTSSDHAYARAIYAMEVVYAAHYAAGLGSPQGIVELFGIEFMNIWAVAVIIAASSALRATFLNSERHLPEYICEAERNANLGLFLLLGFQVACAAITGKSVPGYVIVVVALVIAAGMRFVQTHNEKKRIEKSRLNPTLVHDAFLGESDSE